MALLYLLFLVCAAVPIAIGVLGYRQRWSLRGGPTGWGMSAAARFGRPQAAVGILVLGAIATFVVGIVLGFLAKALEGPLDKPVFNWVYARVPSTSKFTTLNAKLTTIGNVATIELISLFALAILCAAYRRRWWIPPVFIIGMFFLERYEQKSLAKIVHRGHPPTTLGTFPSGGVARILAVEGMILLLAILLIPSLSRAWRVGLWTGLATTASLEVFTRVYLSKHWLTDAVFGLPFGAMLLVTGIAVMGAVNLGASSTEPVLDSAGRSADPSLGSEPPLGLPVAN
jgi:hypothetical protein